MGFHEIDRSTWKREPYFQHYFSDVPCTYSLNAQLDITGLLAAKMKLYPTMLYFLTKAVNRHEEFRMAINGAGAPGVFDATMPCYTIFHKETETFSNIWTEFDADYDRFCAGYEQDLRLYGTVEKINAKPNAPPNCFSVSMVPWVSFDGFCLNLQKGYDYLPPIFTMGKYHRKGDEGAVRWLLPLAVRAHHAVCDGFHVSRLFNELQELIDAGV